MIRKYVQYFKNMLKYIKSGGVVLVNVSFTQPNRRLAGKTIFISGGTDRKSTRLEFRRVLFRSPFWKKELQS